jgi:TonB family protein
MKKILHSTLILYFTSITAQEYEVLTVDGENFKGTLVSIDKNSVKLKGKYGIIEIPSSDIMVLYYPEYVKELGSLEVNIEKFLLELESTVEELFNIDDVKPKTNLDSLKEKDKPSVEFIPYDDPPRPLTPIRPKYPQIAQEKRIEGTVIVQVFIDEKGRVKETKIMKGIPNSGLDEAAIEAIKKTRFKPAKAREKKVGVWISIPVNFRLK